jgi:WD40 repeat protein
LKLGAPVDSSLIADGNSRLTRWRDQFGPGKSLLLSDNSPKGLPGVIVANQIQLEAQSSPSALSRNPNLHVPEVKLELAITKPVKGDIRRITYSPDGQYLAMGVDAAFPTGLSTGKKEIVVWDLKANKEQCRILDLQYYSIGFPEDALSWSPDGKYITFGKCQTKDPNLDLWDPMTGALAKALEVQADSARFNRDGSRLFVCTVSGTDPKRAAYRIYDTKSWDYKDYPNEGIGVGTFCWVGNDQLVLAGGWTMIDPAPGVTPFPVDGIRPQSEDRLVVRRVDLFNKNECRTMVKTSFSDPVELANLKKLSPNGYWRTGVADFLNLVAAFDGGRIAIGETLGGGEVMVLDGETLETLYTVGRNSIPATELPASRGAKTFSTDGKYLFLVGEETTELHKPQSWVLDAKTGAPLTSFPAGDSGIAVNPVKSEIAVGSAEEVKIFSIN